VAHPSLPFNGQGSMRSAFTFRAGGKERARKNKAKELKRDLKDPAQAKEVDEAVAKDLEGERVALVAWIHADDPKSSYENDNFPLPAELSQLAVTPRFVDAEGSGRSVKIKSIFENRCTRCHSESVGGPGSQYPLDKYEDIALYQKTEASTGKSLAKLALTTHVHLLGFSVLYGMTGIIFALSSWPGLVRLVIAPLPLLAQVIDIGFWWLARIDEPHGPMFAQGIRFTGMVVASSLGLQILLTLWGLFRRTGGRILLMLLLVAAAVVGHQVKEKVIDPYLASEKAGMVHSK
jgi:hypothetical protein